MQRLNGRIPGLNLCQLIVISAVMCLDGAGVYAQSMDETPLAIS
jgi:hypothetical protein